MFTFIAVAGGVIVATFGTWYVRRDKIGALWPWGKSQTDAEVFPSKAEAKKAVQDMDPNPSD
ncbi:MAG: hypothetical protein AAB443_00160 [Patescibacteria group bacterium]